MKQLFSHGIILLSLLFFIQPVHAEKPQDIPLPLAAGICVNKAQLLFQANKIETAINTLETFTSQRKGKTAKDIKEKGYDHYYIHFILGNYYLIQSQKDTRLNARKNAMQCYKKSVTSFPSFSPAWLNLAKCYYETDQFSKAAFAFEKGYDHSKIKKAIHLYYASVCYFQARDSEKALAEFKRMIIAHPDKITLERKEILVNILFSLDQNTQALPYIEELASKSRPEKQKKWQEILLQQYLFLSLDKKALAYAEHLAQTDPLDPKWWKGLSHIYLKSGNLKKGLSALIIYGYLTPMTQQEILLAADLYLSLDIPKKAAGFYETALQQIQNPDTLKKLIQASIMAHDHDNALKWINKAQTVSKDIQLEQLKNYILHIQKFYAGVSYTGKSLPSGLSENIKKGQD
ncbi:MAG: hypothetical protein GY699_10920 [Desulfobacteraceae bacterium]|nr:hypothetical protein [Desulfobacteraceae bacterium]